MFQLGWKLCTLIILLLQSEEIDTWCTPHTALSGRISDSRAFGDRGYSKCWKVNVPEDHFIHIKMNYYKMSYEDCDYAYLEISAEKSNESYKFCGVKPLYHHVTAHSDVTITYNLRSRSYYHSMGNFDLSYEIKTGVAAIDGVAEAQKGAIEWLISKWTEHWGWQENTARAVTALFLGGAANFNGSVLEEELMAKHVELKALESLLWTTITAEQLSMSIHALLVTCRSPRRFYGNDLVKRFRDQMQSPDNFTHPAAYLTLCNANDTWPDKASADLSHVLDSDSKHLFVRDMKAFAIMALSCMSNRTQFLSKAENSNLNSLYQKTIKQFKEYQTLEGSFGNAHTTALMTQALLSSGQELAKDWKLNATIKYLMREMNSTSVDFITNYLTLPVFNRRSLSDIAKVNCSANSRKHGDDDLKSERRNYMGPKIRVQYSLFIGNDKDIIHTISSGVPENSTALNVMQWFENQDAKYKFKWKRVSGQIYIHEIAEISNDPETGKFWRMYTTSSNNTEVVHSNSDPEQAMLSEGGPLTMWYQTVHI